ncbi:MAG: SDR family NAD(P)-dependent oxidoreductase [Acidobacteriaceae bacterium]|nr:SDR family NAD(P)-dependent oxidoreductase [Acidobacteriaceae bacterium]
MATKQLAVITGASSGIGYELAKVFGNNGFDLLVTADSKKIDEAADQLRQLGFSVQSVQSDLATYEGVEKLWSEIEATGKPVDAAAINAGIGAYGDFARESDLDTELKLIQLNVTSTVHLAKRILKQMVARNSGKILFTSSIAGTMPAPLEAVYAASKAFILSLAESLHHELKNTNIAITALQPGPTDTNFFHRAGMDDTKLGQEGKYTNDPLEVAEQGFQALMENKDHVFASSMKTKVQGELGKFMPESVKAEMHRKEAERK